MKEQGVKRKRILERNNEELFTQVKPEYYFENGLRKVKPYYFEYQTYVKERWEGRTILDVFKREFRDRPAQYYQEAIRQKMITVNHEPCELDHILHTSELIGHRLHRHEPPVSAAEIKIIYEGEGMLVVDKPASLPAHPAGRYRFNTLVEILREERQYVHLSVINRLDRVTSGLCVLATNPETAAKLCGQMEERKVRKEYVARVIGSFPTDPIRCEAPLKVIDHKMGIVTVSEVGAKESITEFELIKQLEGGKESLVRCKPLTGRTHQIRVHLRHLGHPISNDHIYNNEIWQREGLEGEEGYKLIARSLLQETMLREEGVALEEALRKQEQNHKQALCPDCELNRSDPRPEDLLIYLHAYKYSSVDGENDNKWSFQTELPSWATTSNE